MKELEGIGELKEAVRKVIARNQEIGKKEVDYSNGVKIIDQYTSEQVWCLYNSSMTGEFGYEGTFKEILSGKTIAQIVAEKKFRKGEVVAMDLMGSGLQELGIDHLLAVRLGINPNFIYEGEILQGDILKSSTWDGIKAFLERKKKKSFDLIVCRSCGGLDYIPYNLGLYNSLAGRIWSLLSPDEGTLLSQLPRSPFLYEHEEENILSDINVYFKNKGISSRWVDRSDNARNVTMNYPTIMMVRKANSPTRLPEINLNNLIGDTVFPSIFSE